MPKTSLATPRELLGAANRTEDSDRGRSYVGQKETAGCCQPAVLETSDDAEITGIL